MSELKPCPLCEAEKPFLTVTPEIGIPSGDSGYLMTIKCRDCGCAITRWALKKAWAMESAEAAWNRRAQPDNAPLTLEELRGMEGEPVWIEGGRFWALVSVSGQVVYLTENSGEMVYADKWMKHMGNILRRKPEGGDR